MDNLKKKYQHHLSLESASREYGPFQMLGRIQSDSDIKMLSFAGGEPNPSKFPIHKLSVSFPEVNSWEKDTNKDATVSYELSNNANEGSLDLLGALQYGQCQGIPELVKFIKDHVGQIHMPQYKDWDIKITNGNTIGLEYCLRLLVNRGDCILIEKYTYPAAITAMRPLGVKFIPIDMDENGMLPESFEKVMETWDSSLGARPHVLYTIPTGQNPTGSTLTLERRKKFLTLAKKYDIIIVEDEPYYFLQMEKYDANWKPDKQAFNISSFKKKLIPSLLHLDTDGRVLRVDSFSKLIVPGLRLGWITGNSLFIDRITRYAEVCTESPSGVSQVVLYAILNRWGQNGFLEWLQDLQNSYTMRRNALLLAADKHLPKSVCKYHSPKAGLFLWVELDKNRLICSNMDKSISEIEMEIFVELVNNGVKPVCGQLFMGEPNSADKIFFRFAYSLADLSTFEAGLERFTSTIQKYFQL
ncbi:aromatic aminotransferase [Schizosaccharomyces pombe]|uniref:Aromatic amino acid aminotransferase C569.07 n=1 Tax=Schizosaccharomyces pombe (strain 972 / ATCC 24843) TaxID=284812 RepID=AATR3_SCHPO|nr:putative aromatic aminotransferase [Schizosaccharomyces pombe]Q9Y7S6.1 RecName: Full=Aromatic amino acid aminotransferase C569.07 [Schizosaccharomyces pombe 972h-]CAB42068.1 aromatic aminotransferase (predicted) [Schizosaccharomyces pombe]|eukprot:NP_588566.1 putative aromatic aminotransferase [Schizosaccharomyces pombe]